MVCWLWSSTEHPHLIVEQYRALPPNYKAVQNGMDPSMAGAYLTRVGIDFMRASIDLHCSSINFTQRSIKYWLISINWYPEV